MDDHIQRWPAARPGPYGTNEGDLWACDSSDVGKRLADETSGGVLITQMMMEDGKLQECIYWTKDVMLIAAARDGLVKYVEAQARRN